MRKFNHYYEKINNQAVAEQATERLTANNTTSVQVARRISGKASMPRCGTPQAKTNVAFCGDPTDPRASELGREHPLHKSIPRGTADRERYTSAW